jgi:hypothetical protein
VFTSLEESEELLDPEENAANGSESLAADVARKAIGLSRCAGAAAFERALFIKTNLINFKRTIYADIGNSLHMAMLKIMLLGS